MPNSISLQQILVWLCVGFFVGAGWTLGALVVSRLLR